MSKKILKKILVLSCVSVVTVASLSACGKTVAQDSKTTTSQTKNAQKSEILVVSFGTSFNNSRNITIGGIEAAVREAHPDCDVKRAFTSQIIIDKLKKRDGIEIDNIKQALERAKKDGVTDLTVVTTHLMSGHEYTDVKNAVKKYGKGIKSVVVEKPLLDSDKDYEKLAQILTEKYKAYDDGETAICFMGHGTDADSNVTYANFQKVLTAQGKENFFVGTVEAKPSVEDLIEKIKANPKYKKVVLMPLMVVAGDHANNDMAGDEEDSWKSKFKAQGYDVTCILEGLGQDYDVQQMYVNKIK
ncbi:sirohydrochlorin cobaltochelatase [Lachnobacterium bovis]|uniref:Sirohydrochlorin cobaltochelatase n=1 Tax=Lachnobacterium bovis TaxID=140626 RepID=A0A1H9SB58_9FIRM|nr:sirohydrochlorin cobaltochelatase [Lachnobacterium bovis]SER82227.1 sirohydrochlorin cobaltochelatase [Lachnobacterium bovis]